MYGSHHYKRFFSPSTESSSLNETKIKVGIIGGAGYTGGELVRILINHLFVDIAFVYSKSNAGNAVSSVHSDLVGETDLVFSDDFDVQVDVVFLCLSHGDAKKFVDANAEKFSNTKIIDLSNDYRLHTNGHALSVNGEPFVYGLPELNKQKICNAKHVANPGCFATAIQLGLLPLAKENLLTEVYTTGITGSTGAGQSLAATSHFSWRANNISAYKTLTHQHLKEIIQSLQQLQPSFSTAEEALFFVPWRGDFTRGIYSSSTVNCNLSLVEVYSLYNEFYKNEPFTYVSEKMVDLKQVVNTNKCLIHIEKVGSKIVVHSAIDNLLKGASGQAVQNMNIMFDFKEDAGLRLKAASF